tara:strand:+ start:33693 stop:33875 length:183 start_codon:yes stop_codon:yes gene_type:complete
MLGPSAAMELWRAKKFVTKVRRILIRGHLSRIAMKLAPGWLRTAVTATWMAMTAKRVTMA